MFSYMKVHCPICRAEFNGMSGYGRIAACCSKECSQEWEWRHALAVMGEAYRPKNEPDANDLAARAEALVEEKKFPSVEQALLAMDEYAADNFFRKE